KWLLAATSGGRSASRVRAWGRALAAGRGEQLEVPHLDGVRLAEAVARASTDQPVGGVGGADVHGLARDGRGPVRRVQVFARLGHAAVLLDGLVQQLLLVGLGAPARRHPELDAAFLLGVLGGPLYRAQQVRVEVADRRVLRVAQRNARAVVDLAVLLVHRGRTGRGAATGGERDGERGECEYETQVHCPDSFGVGVRV